MPRRPFVLALAWLCMPGAIIATAQQGGVSPAQPALQPAHSIDLSTAEPGVVLASGVQRLPQVTATSARIADLEARLAEVEELLRKQAADFSTDQSRTKVEEKAPPGDDKKGGYVVGSDLKMTASWKNGFEVQTANKDFRVHVGGRTQLDGVWLHAAPVVMTGAGGVGTQDAVDFRRARLRVDGTLYELIDWVVEYDFVNSVNLNPQQQQPTQFNIGNVPAPTDLWWNIQGLPLINNLRIGNQKEPIGLEHLTSSRFLDFMERSFNQDAFTGPFNNGFTPGLQIFDTYGEEHGTWSAGVFKNNSNPFAFGVGDGEYAGDARITYLPWYDEPSGGRYLWHVGGAVSYRGLDNGQVRIRARPSLRNGPSALNPNIVDTGSIFGTTQTLAAAETAAVIGPLLLQGEYIASFVADAAISGGPNLGTYFSQGWYVEALYFLTGEHREYERKYAHFGRVVPYSNATWARGEGCRICTRGAWQLGARYSKLSLRDQGIDGGIAQDVTVGLNWFWNPNMKVQFNYVWTHRNAPGGQVNGDINGFGMRFAQDF